MRRTIWTLLVIVLAIICGTQLSVKTQAATIIDSGTCAGTITWTLDSAGLLTISGTGSIPNYPMSGETPPWYSRAGLIKTIVIEEGIANIGSYAFQGLQQATKVVLSEGVTRIYYGAFQGLQNLKELHLPSTLQYIQENTFSNCDALTDVYITDLAVWCKIDFNLSGNPMIYTDNLYLNGTKITGALTIPEGVTQIPAYAFDGCEITSITLPSTVATVENYAFENCSVLEAIVVSPQNPHFSSKDGLLYDKAQTKLIRAPGGKTGSITLPDTLLFIENYAFLSCRKLDGVSIPEGTLSIGESAFSGCYNLKTVSIPKSVTSIGTWAFSFCTGLAEISLPEGITAIRSLFWGCSGLKSVILPESLTKIDGNAFSECGSNLICYIPKGVTFVYSYAFRDTRAHILYGGTEAGLAEIKNEHNNGAFDNIVISHLNCTGKEIQNGVCTLCGKGSTVPTATGTTPTAGTTPTVTPSTNPTANPTQDPTQVSSADPPKSGGLSTPAALLIGGLLGSLAGGFAVYGFMKVRGKK